MAVTQLPHPPDLSRRERKKLALRQRILEAAFSLFDEQGFAATRVAEISERADVAHKTFFNYFPTKQHLLSEVAGEALKQLLSDIEEVRKAPLSTRERLRRFLVQLAENTERAGPMHRELLTELIHVAHESGTEHEQARQLHAAFGSLVREGRAAGDVTTAHSVQTLTELVLGAFYALMFNWAHLPGYALRRQALAVARLLGDAITVSPKQESS